MWDGSMPFFRSIAQINTSSQTASVPMSTFSPPLLPDPVVPASRACRRRNDTRHVPGTCRRPPGPVGVAVPLRDSTRHHGGRDAHLRLVAPRHTPRLVGLPASYLRPDGVRGVVFGGHLGLTRQAERVYAATASVATAGTSRPRRCSPLSPRLCRRYSAWER
jgi:hypothetical protein